MTGDTSGSANETPLEGHLRAHYAALQRDEEQADCPELQSLALALAEEAEPGDRKRVLAHAAGCAPCSAVMLSSASLGLNDQPAQRPPVTLPRAMGVGVLAIAAALLLVVRPTPVTVSLQSFEEPELRLKGAAPSGDSLVVAAQRGGRQWRVEYGDSLREGDLIGLFYSARRSGYLMVAYVEGTGKVTPLYPAVGVTSAPVEAAGSRSLRTGGVMKGGTGCEWFVAVFSEAPLDRARVHRELSDLQARSSGCLLQPTIPGARSVAAVLIRR